MDIRQRIGVQKRAAQMATGGEPMGLMLGEDQLIELKRALQVPGMTSDFVLTEYDGMKISRPVGVDGIVIVMETLSPPLSIGGVSSVVVRRHTIGAHPILF